MGKSLNIRIFTKKLLIVTVRRNCLATLISSRTKLHTEEYFNIPSNTCASVSSERSTL